jgi:hypothetical protein
MPLANVEIPRLASVHNVRVHEIANISRGRASCVSSIKREAQPAYSHANDGAPDNSYVRLQLMAPFVSRIPSQPHRTSGQKDCGKCKYRRPNPEIERLTGELLFCTGVALSFSLRGFRDRDTIQASDIQPAEPMQNRR